jgi:hypothetical protein
MHAISQRRIYVVFLPFFLDCRVCTHLHVDHNDKIVPDPFCDIDCNSLCRVGSRTQLGLLMTPIMAQGHPTVIVLFMLLALLCFTLNWIFLQLNRVSQVRRIYEFEMFLFYCLGIFLEMMRRGTPRKLHSI